MARPQHFDTLQRAQDNLIRALELYWGRPLGWEEGIALREELGGIARRKPAIADQGGEACLSTVDHTAAEPVRTAAS